MSLGGIVRELWRHRLWRIGVLYSAGALTMTGGIVQLGPVLGTPDWVPFWFLIAAAVGLPIWIAFVRFYELAPEDAEDDGAESHSRAAGRKLDFWIIGAFTLAVALLLAALAFRHGGTPTPIIAENSIAVLPFVNESGGAEAVSLSDGLSDGFIEALSQFPGLKVIGRASSFQFRGRQDASDVIGGKLGVAHLLEGSVQRAGDTVRISAELINAKDGTTLWSQHYDRPYADLFRLQDDITDAVATALKTRLLGGQTAPTRSGRPPSGSLEAYNQYLLARYYINSHITEAATRNAIKALDIAVKIDPRYATAWGGLAVAWTNLGAGYLSGAQAQDAFSQARAAANRATALGSDLANTHLAQGTVLENADSDLVGAEAEYRRAMELAPNDDAPKFDLGFVLAKLGRVREAIKWTNEALTVDPLNASAHYQLASFYVAVGRLDDARRSIRRTIDLQPDGLSFNAEQAVIEIAHGDADAALRAARQEPAGPWQDVAVAWALQAGVDRTPADAALNNLIAKDGDQAPFQIAGVYALRKDPDKTFEWLNRAWALHDGGVDLLLYDPFILRYRNDPRFAAYCRKVGLPTVTDATVGLPAR